MHQEQEGVTRREFLGRAALATGAFLWGCSSSDPQWMTVSTTAPTSGSAELPSAIDPPNELGLEFSEPLDMGTVEGRVSLYVVKSGGQLTSSEPPVEVVPDSQTRRRLTLRTKNGAKLPSGNGYKLVVSKGIQSASGKTLEEDFVRYFATDYELGSGKYNIPGLGNTRSGIIVISDLHMGDARSINGKYGWFNKNRDTFVSFLSWLRQNPNVRELVVAGDVFDEWVAPMTSDTFDGASESAFVDMIAAANTPAIAAMNAIVQDGNIVVTYVPGNHDMLVQSADIQRVFPGISEARDAQGLGSYTPLDRPEVIIEHGHRYDLFNAPDMISNRSITHTNSILPPGFFVSKIATTSDLERGQSVFLREQLTNALADRSRSNYLSYWAAWQLIMEQKPVKESWDDKLIETDVDGYEDTYAIADLIPYHDSDNGPLDVNLYKKILDTWYERQAGNQVAVPISPDIAIAAGAINPVLDAQAISQYFLNGSSNKRIVVFGHTHAADLYGFLNHALRGSIYANSGTWIDSGNPGCTFVAVIPPKDSESSIETVTVYRYVDDLNITKIESGAIVV